MAGYVSSLTPPRVLETFRSAGAPSSVQVDGKWTCTTWAVATEKS